MTPINTEQMSPTFDLHVHLRGTMQPALARRLSRKNKVPLSSGMFKANGEYRYQGFEDFLEVYDRVGRVICHAEDLHTIAFEYLQRVAAEGTRYVEFMHSPFHSIENGIPYNEQILGIAEAIEAAKAQFCIDAALVVTCVRHRGAEEALDLAEVVVEHAHPIVVGFGMTGNELIGDPKDFAGAFLVAKSGGLQLTAHAGEWRGASTILRAVDTLGLTRIGHGVRTIDDAKVTRELVSRGLGFEICLSSNFQLGVASELLQHPVKQMMDAGCRLSLATDDPAYFSTTPAKEFQLGMKCGLTREQLDTIRMLSIEIAFCNEKKKEEMRSWLKLKQAM